MGRRTAVVVSVLLVCFVGGSASAPVAQDAPPAATGIVIRTSPIVDLHFYVRSLVESEDGAAPPELRACAEVAREFRDRVGSGFGWAFIEANLPAVRTAAELQAEFAALPEVVRRRDGSEVALGEPARRLAEAYAQAESAFLEQVWPRHERVLADAARRLEGALLKRLEDCLGHVLGSLMMRDPQAEVPVFLVADAPPPQGVTHRRRGGGPVCFVGVEGLDVSLLSEIVLHEAIHALDVLTEESGSALVQLRRQLRAAGYAPTSPAYRDVPHTLIFVQAAETIRRKLAPDHSDYGEVHGYYDRIGAAVRAVRPVWRELLDGQIAPQEAIDRIVESAVELLPPERAPASRPQRENP